MSNFNSTEAKRLRREARAEKNTKVDFVIKAIPFTNKYGMTRFSMVKMPSMMFK